MDVVTTSDFDGVTATFRPELVVHCYRMTGSVHDAEDLTQETLLRAWRARDTYRPERASLRTWLYRIATNVCLTALASRTRRVLPSGIVGLSGDPAAPLRADTETPWLEPLPDRFLTSTDPAFRVAQRAGVRLALVAALQLLPPRQRAVLVLRDVLGFSAAETATQLAASTAAVNSALQRARSTLSATPLDPDTWREPDDPAVRRAVDRYVRAFEAADVRAIVALLAHDVILEMPPVPLWLAGRADYGAFLARVFSMRGGGWRMLPTTANGQPALAAYCPDGQGGRRLHTLQVLSVGDGGIRHNVVFQDAGVLATFGLAPAV